MRGGHLLPVHSMKQVHCNLIEFLHAAHATGQEHSAGKAREEVTDGFLPTSLGAAEDAAADKRPAELLRNAVVPRNGHAGCQLVIRAPLLARHMLGHPMQGADPIAGIEGWFVTRWTFALAKVTRQHHGGTSPSQRPASIGDFKLRYAERTDLVDDHDGRSQDAVTCGSFRLEAAKHTLEGVHPHERVGDILDAIYVCQCASGSTNVHEPVASKGFAQNCIQCGRLAPPSLAQKGVDVSKSIPH